VNTMIFLTIMVCAAAAVTALLVWLDKPSKRTRAHQIDSAELIKMLQNRG